MYEDNAGVLTIGVIILAILGYVFIYPNFSSSNNRKVAEIDQTFFYYQNKNQYIDQCGEFFITQKEFVDKDDRVSELCEDFANVLNKINKELYYGDSGEGKPNCTPDTRGTECE